MAKKDGRKDEDLAILVGEMLVRHKKWREITAELGITNARLSKIMKEYIHRSVQTQEPQEASSVGFKVPPPAEQKIINDTARKSIDKITNTLSTKLYEEYISRIEAARVMDEMDARYRTTVESWGYRWEDFVQSAIEHAYNVMRTYKMWEPVMKAFFKERGYYYQ